jgi:hypothetical protein
MKKAIMLLIVLVCCTFHVIAQNDPRVDAIYQVRIMHKIAELEMDDILSLWFTDADTGLPIEGMVVAIQNAGSVKTDADGLAMFPVVDDGEHSFIVQKEGYVMLKDSFTVFEGVIFFNKYSIPKTLPLKYVKIVLDWGENPADLDLHLEKRDIYHISYRDMKKSADGNAWLDRDDTNGYGPETITITEVDTNATYRVYIHDYTNKGNAGSSKLSASKGTVRVYIDNRLANSFAIPQNKSGIKWNVFDIVRGVVKPVNTVE